MNREIKFRAWDSKNNKWLKHIPNSEYMLDSIKWSNLDTEEAYGIYPNEILNRFSFGGRIIFCQYTGVKDKNGKEIYEGDIIQKICHKSFFDIEGYLEKFEVRWCDEKCGWRGFNKRVPEGRIHGISIFHGECEVIGNIFENEYKKTV